MVLVCVGTQRNCMPRGAAGGPWVLCVPGFLQLAEGTWIPVAWGQAGGTHFCAHFRMRLGGEAASPARPQGPPRLMVQPGPAGRNPLLPCHHTAPKISILPLRAS